MHISDELFEQFAFRHETVPEEVVCSPAKVNLLLKVGAKVSSGRHLIRTVIAPISLMDLVGVCETSESSGITISNHFSEQLKAHHRAVLRLHPEVEAEFKIMNSEKNLAVRAAKLFLDETGIKTGLRILIDKRIPIQAGLGGGSSNAAAVLRALNARYPGRVSIERLLELGSTLGADVGPLLLIGPMFSYGTGEKMIPVSLAGSGFCKKRYLILKPPEGVSTAWAYGALGRTLGGMLAENDNPFEDPVLKSYFSGLPASQGNLDEIKPTLPLTLQLQVGNSENLSDRGRFSFIRTIPENDFQTVVCQHRVELQHGVQALKDVGAEEVLLAGSGSALLGIFTSDESIEAGIERLRSCETEGWFLAFARPYGW